MTCVTRWWWIRHAPVTSDGGCIYGQSDIACDISDQIAFQALARMLPQDAVWLASNLQRTQMTARAIREAGLEAAEPVIEPDFAEQHFGVWQGRKRAEVFAERHDWRGFWLAPARTAPPGGESFVALLERTGGAIRRWSATHRGRDIVAVAHGGTIRAALAVALALEPETALAFAIDNLAVTRLDHILDGEREAWRVVTVNQPPR